MKFPYCVVFIFIFSVCINCSNVLARINSTSKISSLFKYNSISRNGTITFKQKSKDCNCGVLSRDCHVINGKIFCDCQDGSLQKGNECAVCNCGVLSTKCYFKNNEEACECRPGSAETSYHLCKWCDCGYPANSCEFQGYNKICFCGSGYIQENGKCKACDCGYNSISCSLDYSGVRRCKCNEGYVAKARNYWSDNESCIAYSSTSGWRIATYIEGLFFSIIIIGLVIVIISRKAA